MAHITRGLGDMLQLILQLPVKPPTVKTVKPLTVKTLTVKTVKVKSLTVKTVRLLKPNNHPLQTKSGM